MSENKITATNLLVIGIPIIINGPAGAGKDTFVNCMSKLESYDKSNAPMLVYNVSSVDPIKEAARVLGWDGSKSEKDRKFLADLKKLSIEYNNYPLEYMVKQYYDKVNNTFTEYGNKMNLNPIFCFVFFHIRETKEILKLKIALPKCKALYIDRDISRNIEHFNISDQESLNYQDNLYDFYIQNNGTVDDLMNQANKFTSWIRDLYNEKLL